MPVVINGTSGITGPDGSTSTPAVRGSDTDTGFVFAAGQITASLNGTSGNVPLVSMTAQASTSGTSIDFTGIPSWVKRITVMFRLVSTSGTLNLQIQLGAGSFTTSGYSSVSSHTSGGTSIVPTAVVTSGLVIRNNTGATGQLSGNIYLTNITGNTWVSSHSLCETTDGRLISGAGEIALSGTLDRVRITTVSPSTDTFDAGSINILYE